MHSMNNNASPSLNGAQHPHNNPPHGENERPTTDEQPAYQPHCISSAEERGNTPIRLPEWVLNPPNDCKRSVEEAQAEVERELNVRRKCFGRWVTEGKLSKVDANDRLERLESANFFLNGLLDMISQAMPA